MRARGPVGHTCPKIDACISAIESVYNGKEGYGILDDLLGSAGLLEEIRSANEALRDWGAEQEDEASDLRGEVSDLTKTVSSQEDRIAELERELAEALAAA
jgi:hypothetical protein